MAADRTEAGRLAINAQDDATAAKLGLGWRSPGEMAMTA